MQKQSLFGALTSPVVSLSNVLNNNLAVAENYSELWKVSSEIEKRKGVVNAINEFKEECGEDAFTQYDDSMAYLYSGINPTPAKKTQTKVD